MAPELRVLFGIYFFSPVYKIATKIFNLELFFKSLSRESDPELERSRIKENKWSRSQLDSGNF